eukprot:361015-Rhodomonas_salina.1
MQPRLATWVFVAGALLLATPALAVVCDDAYLEETAVPDCGTVTESNRECFQDNHPVCCDQWNRQMPTAYEGPRCENTDEMVITGGVEEGGDDKAVAACTQFTEMWTGFQNDETCGDKWYDFTSDEDTTTKAVELCNSCGKEFERFEAFGLQYFAALNNANCPVGDTTVQAFAMMKAAYGTCLTDTDGGESCYEVVQETLSASPPGDSTVSSGGASGTMHEDAVVDEDWTDTPKDGSEGPPPGATRRNDATECLTTCNKWGA